MTRLLLASTLFLGLACAQNGGGTRLESRTGRVIDEATGGAIERADVFQVYWKKGRVGEPPRATALRWSEANERGEFEFARASRDAEGRSPGAGDALEYGFYHPAFGLVRSGPPRSEGPLELRGRRLDAAGRRAAELQLCGSRPVDAVHAGVAARHCPRPNRNP